MGAGMSCTSEIAEAGALIAAAKLRRVSPYFVPRILVNMAAGAVSIRHQLRGPNHAVSTACATGVHCIGDAFRMVQRGDAEVMLAGGVCRHVNASVLLRMHPAQPIAFCMRRWKQPRAGPCVKPAVMLLPCPALPRRSSNRCY